MEGVQGMNIVEYRAELDLAANSLKDSIAKAHAVFVERVDKANVRFFSDPDEARMPEGNQTRNEGCFND